MTSHPRDAPNLSPDVLHLVFEQLECDTLCKVGLTCHAWRSLSSSPLFRFVDLSCHNIGEWKVPSKDGGDNSEVSQCYRNGKMTNTEYLANIRPVNLVRRQRAFLHTITANPKLATHVRSLTWTLVWKELTDTCLTEIDRKTWNVFSQMKKVTKLELASLHHIHEDSFVRQSPSQLFPAVIDLRLVGWMHRGMVKAIFASMDTARLRSLTLDYLQDEGAHPDGSPMSRTFAREYSVNLYDGGSDMENPSIISQALLDRQESGRAFIFPGPMWLPLHILSTARLDSLTQLRVDIPPLSGYVHLPNYHTMFLKTTDLIRAASANLESLVIILGDSLVFPDYAGKMCGSGRQRMRRAYYSWRLEMVSSYMYQLATVLSEHSFPKLNYIRFEGFDLLDSSSARSARNANLGRTLEAVRNCPFAARTSFTEFGSENERPIFNGYISKDSPEEWEGDLEAILGASLDTAI